VNTNSHPKTPPRSSLRFRLLFSFALVYLFTTTVVVLSLYLGQLAGTKERLRQEKDYLLDSLSEAIALPLWNIDLAACRHLLVSTMAHPDLESAYVYDENDVFVGGAARDRSGKGAVFLPYQPSAAGEKAEFSGALPITYNGRTIGRIELSVTDRLAIASLTSGLFRSVALSSIIILSGIAVLFAYLNLSFVGRLVGLRDALSAFSGTDLTVRMEVRENDEIGDLARNFNGLADRIQSYAQRLEALVEERTGLLREVHHRVKNNLQVVTSLISLALEEPGRDPGRIIAEIQSRVMSMALVHDQIYSSPDLETIDCASLVAEIVGLSAAGFVPLDIGIEAGRLALRLDLAIPFALLLNELLLFAEAWRGSGPGEGKIIVRFRPRDAEGLVGFEIRCGPRRAAALPAAELREGIFASVSGALTKQLAGTLSVREGESLEIDFSFPDSA
jgi:two-component sensor histidine kinase